MGVGQILFLCDEGMNQRIHKCTIIIILSSIYLVPNSTYVGTNMETEFSYM